MPLLQSNFNATATVGGEPLGAFQTVSGGEVTAEVVRDRAPSGNDISQPVPAPRDIGNVTISRSWVESRDAPILARLDRHVGREENNSTVARHPLDGDGNPKGTDRTWIGVLIRATGPEGDRNSTDKATLELEFAIGNVS